MRRVGRTSAVVVVLAGALVLVVGLMLPATHAVRTAPGVGAAKQLSEGAAVAGDQRGNARRVAQQTKAAAPASAAAAPALIQTSAQAHAQSQAQSHSRALTRARMKIVAASVDDGAGLDISPHFRFADSNVDSELLDELNNMLIQTQARAVREHCQLLGNWFGYVVQASLGLIAFSALIVKKYLDTKHRDWWTWARDTSKQALGSIAAHFLNLGFATLLQSRPSEDPCVYYLVNYLVDAVLGCALSLLLLWAFDSMADKYDWEMLRSGDYGNENDQPTVWKRWAAQLGLWLGIITISKLVLLFCLIVPAKAPLYAAGKWMMSGLVNYPRWELVIVMIIIPLVLNVVQFWIQDNFLMDHNKPTYQHLFRPVPAMPAAVPVPAPNTQPPTAAAPAAAAPPDAPASTPSASTSVAVSVSPAVPAEDSASLLAGH